MPYYRGPRVHALPFSDNKPIHNDVVSDTVLPIDEAAAALLPNIVTSTELGSTLLGIWPVVFGNFTTANPSLMDSPAQAFYNSEFPALAYSITRFHWAAYGFNSGHFISIIEQRNLLFLIVMACDPFANSCALFNEVVKCPNVLHGAGALLNHICTLGNTSLINRYIISMSHGFHGDGKPKNGEE
jgi:hypothetical protein